MFICNLRLAIIKLNNYEVKVTTKMLNIKISTGKTPAQLKVFKVELVRK